MSDLRHRGVSRIRMERLFGISIYTVDIDIENVPIPKREEGKEKERVVKRHREKRERK